LRATTADAESDDRATAKRRRRQRLVVTAVAMAVGTLVARRLGYNIGANTVVRCRDGHLFTTIWIPGVSVKAIRLGWWRFQRCPVGNHWTLVRPVKEAELSEEERADAARYRDARVP
jgi:hypothetical protein